MKTTKTKLEEAQKNYIKSVRILLGVVASFHALAFAYYFPHATIVIVGTAGAFIIIWQYIDLMYTIDKQNRDNLLNLIRNTQNPHTKLMLIEELYEYDTQILKIAPDPLHDYRY